ncbi:hypothetical protein V8B97DRAFT_1915479 [Scleroderma yunnanense]
MSAVACAMRSNTCLYMHDDTASLTSNSLTPQQRAAIRRSDRKAEQILGVTLTRDVNVNAVNTLTPYRSFGAFMARISANRTKSRQMSNVTLGVTLKDFGVKMKGLDKLLMTYGRNRKKQRYDSSQRVVLGSRAGSNHSIRAESDESSSTASSGEDGRDHRYEGDADEESEDLSAFHAGTSSPTPLAPFSLIPVRNEIEESEDDTTLVDRFNPSRPRFPLAPLSLTAAEHFGGLGRRHSFLDHSPEEDHINPTSCTFPSVVTSISSEELSDPSDTVSTGSDFAIPDFEWDFRDPFNTPPTDPAYAFLQAHYSKMHLGDSIAPHMHDDTGFAEHFPFAHLPPPPPSPSEWQEKGDMNRFDTPVARLSLGSVEDIRELPPQGRTWVPMHRTSSSSFESVESTTSDNGLSLCFQRANLDYVNAMFRAQEAHEYREQLAEELARREKRAKVRSQLKQIALLGEEARQAIIA